MPVVNAIHWFRLLHPIFPKEDLGVSVSRLRSDIRSSHLYHVFFGSIGAFETWRLCNAVHTAKGDETTSTVMSSRLSYEVAFFNIDMYRMVVFFLQIHPL